MAVMLFIRLVARYIGSDSFQFRAGDGDNDSNVATVSITVLSPAPEVIYETGFDTGLPDGWTIINGGDPADTWNSDNADNHTSPYWTDQFMIVDSNYAGYVSMDEQLITHSIDCTNWTGVTLNFKHDFWYYLTQTGDVDVRINGGVWKKVARYRRNDYSGQVELPLSSFLADGDPNVQVRWHYYNAFWDGWWGIDEVKITASPLVPSVVVDKCTVTAGSGDNADKISFSGTMNAGVGNILDADTVDVSIDSNDLGGPAVVTFPVDGNTFKKGKFKYSGTEGIIKESFSYDTKTHKFAFSASNLDLSGLGCPATAMIEIGDFNATDDLDETIVNGKKPIPIKLMTEVMDVLSADKCTLKQGKIPGSNTDQLMVSGGFTVKDPSMTMDDRTADDLVITLDSGTQTFTVLADNLIPGKGKFTCTKADVDEDDSVATATFDFNKCSFTLTIKNTDINDALTDDVLFGISFAGFDESDNISLP